MKRTKWLILCLVLCMAATLGGTIAYLTDSDGDVNVMTLGNVGVDLIEQERDENGGLRDFQKDKMMLPVVGEMDDDGAYGLPANPNFLDKIVRVQCTSSNANAYLRVYIGLPSALRDINGVDALHMLTGEKVSISGSHTTAWPWNQISMTETTIDNIPFDMYCFEYDKLLVPGELTPPVLAGLWLDSSLDTDSTTPGRYVMTLNGTEIPLDYDFSMGLQVPVLVQATQADGFGSAAEAFSASNMNQPKFDDLLDLNIPVQLPAVLENLLNTLTAAFNAGDERPIEVTTDSLPLSDPDFAAQLDALASSYPATTLSIAPVAPEEGTTITIELGKTSLPENISIIAPSGVNLVITGEDFDCPPALCPAQGAFVMKSRIFYIRRRIVMKDHIAIPAQRGDLMQDFMILVNLDDKTCHALARRLRADGTYCRIVPRTATADELLQAAPKGVLLACGYTGKAADVPQMLDYLQSGLPMLCFGDAALTLCQTLGGELAPLQEGGIVTVEIDPEDALYAGLESSESYLPALRGMVFTEDQGKVCAAADGTAIALHVRQRHVCGLAYPLERNDPATIQLLGNFCRSVCGCTPWWSERAFIERAQAQIAEAAGDGEALCALSGGVDSGVTALLGQLALGQKLHCIFIDTGFLREGEADEVMDAYQNQLGMVVRRVDARAEFLLALKAVTDPGEKERIIRTLLREVLRREAAAFPNVRLVLRGTNYADAPDPADAASPIGVPVLEPVKELFKDEIRHVGESLGMPAAMTARQPFPGSGLASRIMAGVTAERLDILRTADAIFRREIESAGLQKRLWQYYAALAVSPLPDGGLLVILRAVQASEGGSGLPARLPSDLLERVTADVIRECPDVQRVFYDCTPSRSFALQDGR